MAAIKAGSLYTTSVSGINGIVEEVTKQDQWTNLFDLPVDSGMIGFVESVYTKPETENSAKKVTFEHPVTITWREGNLSWITSRGEEFRIKTDDDFGDW